MKTRGNGVNRIAREKAKNAIPKQTRFIGTPCKTCNNTLRLTSNTCCAFCQNLHTKAYNARSIEKRRLGIAKR